MFSLTMLIGLSSICLAQDWPDLSLAPSPLEPHVLLDPQQENALIISIQDYAVLPSINRGKSNARDWFRYFSRHRGIPVDQVTWLDGAAATAKNIHAAVESLSLSQGTRLWVVFIGHGATVDKAPRLLPYDTQDSYYDVLRQGVSIPAIVQELEQQEDSEVIAFFDASFNERWGNQPLFSEELPNTKAQLSVSRKSTLFFAAQPADSTYLLPKINVPSFSYMALGALRGWADDDQDGRVYTSELLSYVQKSLAVVQLPNQRQIPFFVGAQDRLLAQTLESDKPNLSAIREEIDPVVESQYGWNVQIHPGSGERVDYLDLVAKVEMQAQQKIDQRRKEELRQGILSVKAKEQQEHARQIWRRMAKARRLGGKEVFELVTRFIEDFDNLVIEVDGLSQKVDIPEVSIAKRWIKEKGRRLEGVLGYDMVLITAEPFFMGSVQAEKHRSKDENLHEVILHQDYFIGSAEVTQELWVSVMLKNPSYAQRCGNQCPVESISWCDALIFANKLSKREGFEKVYAFPFDFEQGMSEDICLEKARSVVADYSKNGYRLPTEAEWEYAARGARNSLYSGSGDIEKVAWSSKNSRIHSHPVGQLQPNDWGLYDMSGNVWEYVWDWYGEYPKYALANYMGPEDGLLKVIRGGSWGLDPSSARIANRHYVSPGYHLRDIGLRLARTAN